jgi:FAD synthetase
MKTVMIFGTFDIVHLGHLNFFKQAKKYGDTLIAVVARDERVEKLKKKTPVYTEKERKYFLEQIRLVDKVLLGDKADVYKKIREIKPDVIALGYDQNYFTEKLEEKIKEFGLKTKVVRAKPYRAETLKSKNIRTRLETTL